ncbi:hypothetical protein CDAR_316822, partial [Caerostris darwini]
GSTPTTSSNNSTSSNNNTSSNTSSSSNNNNHWASHTIPNRITATDLCQETFWQSPPPQLRRLQKAWQLSDAEARDLSKWQKAAHHRFEVLQSVAAIDPARMSSRKRRRTEETNRPNLSLDKLMDTTDLLISPTAFARLGRGVLAEAAPDFHSFPVGSVLCSYYRQFFWLRREFHFAGAAIDFFWPWHMTFTKHRNLRNRIGL